MVTLVTGGTGFVASNIVKALAEHGHEVVAYDVASPNDLLQRYIEPWKDHITFVKGSVLDLEAIERLADSFTIDKVIQAAAYTPGSRGTIEQSDSRRIVETNIMGTVNILDMARGIGVRRFLFISSGAVYEGIQSATPLDEDTPVQPTALYRISKFACERIAERYHQLHGMDTVSVRLGGPYGPLERITSYRANMSLLFDWTGKAVRGEPIEVQTMPPGDYTYVMDIAHGLRTVLDASQLPHRLYNLSRPTSTTASQLVAAFLEAYPDADFIGPIPEDQQATARGHMDVSRIKEDLGVEATTEPLPGLKAYFQWRLDNDFKD